VSSDKKAFLIKEFDLLLSEVKVVFGSPEHSNAGSILKNVVFGGFDDVLELGKHAIECIDNEDLIENGKGTEERINRYKEVFSTTYHSLRKFSLLVGALRELSLSPSALQELSLTTHLVISPLYLPRALSNPKLKLSTISSYD
jgi:hypothetical protein